jgi:hypothetical protein
MAVKVVHLILIHHLNKINLTLHLLFRITFSSVDLGNNNSHNQIKILMPSDKSRDHLVTPIAVVIFLEDQSLTAIHLRSKHHLSRTLGLSWVGVNNKAVVGFKWECKVHRDNKTGFKWEITSNRTRPLKNQTMIFSAVVAEKLSKFKEELEIDEPNKS